MPMTIHDLQQGSPEWLAYRREHDNASDAPAMMGESPYKSRAELIHEYATGITPEVDPVTQRRFDDGHRCEALARPIAEKIIGEELFPVTGSRGRVSASLDGATMFSGKLFEHKLMNDTLRAAFEAIDTAQIVNGWSEDEACRLLPLNYRIQMEQQLDVAEAERVLFMASRWAADGTLLEEHHCWYYPDLELRERIRRGWEQFHADVAAYVPPQQAAEVVAAAPQEHLPAPAVTVSGALAVVSNLDLFGAALRAFVEKIPKAPTTDQEFVDTDAACKRLKDAEDRLQATEDAALASMADVNAMRRTVSELRELARTTRLAAEKMVKARKEQIRADAVARGVAALSEHVTALNRRLGRPLMPKIATDFAGAIKGLKNLDSLRNAIDTELARAKIEASAIADRIEENLKRLTAVSEHDAFRADPPAVPGLFVDLPALVLKDPADCVAVIEQRVAAEIRRREVERERIRAEEAARLQREQEARERAEREAKELAQQQADAAAAEAQCALVTAAAKAAPGVETYIAGNGVRFIRPVSSPTEHLERDADEPATLKLGDINARIAPLKLDAAGMAALGITPAKTEGAAKLYRESDYRLLLCAIGAHVRVLQSPSV